VTIVEFSDFQCPFCAIAEPTLARVRDAYGPDTVRIVWKDNPLPFHPNARSAAEAAAGVYALAGNEAFWRFHDLAFSGQKSLGEESYVAWAQQAGVRDPRAFQSGLESHLWAGKVDAAVSEARELGAVGTPWFFINGVRLAGAEPFQAFQNVIDMQVIAARTKIAGGTPADRVYAVLSKENISTQRADRDDDEDDTKTVFKVPVGSSPSRGDPGALVTIVEYADYQCPYCSRVEPTLRELRASYRDKLRFVFKDEPLTFHARAEPAAEAALEVRAEKGDEAFWAMHDRLLEGPRDLSDDALAQLAASVGAQADKVRVAISKHAHKAEIDADVESAQDFDATGTPHFFINGRRLAGAQPKDAFVAIIDEEVKKAQALIDAGAKRGTLYDALTKDGKGPPEPERKDANALPASDPARGPSSAKVTIHEFADFQCPFCARAEATLKEISKNYGNQVRFVWHDLPLPFHENAMTAARAGREAQRQRGDRAFWDLHDKWLSEGAGLARGELDGDARALGMNMVKWRAALDGDAHKDAIDADRDAAEALGFSGTPSFLVVPAGAKSGYSIVGAQGYARFHEIVERALGEAGGAGLARAPSQGRP
jgi:protein-disulfide isomerase